jgi:hypothetical protein
VSPTKDIVTGFVALVVVVFAAVVVVAADFLAELEVRLAMEKPMTAKISSRIAIALTWRRR